MKIADSILLGGLSVLLAGGSLVLALVSRSGRPVNELVMNAAAVGWCAGPVFALMNLGVAIRDDHFGRRVASYIGAALSGLSLLATVISLGLMD